MDRMRVIVCGGRDYNDTERVAEILQYLPCDTIVVHGGASGADLLAGLYWNEWGTTEVFHADWEKHGKAAGPLRNQEMLDAGADLVIAFPGGRGTADMVRRAKGRGIKVRIVK